VTEGTSTFLLVGLPETGKTTFLAALAHVVTHEADGAGCPLTLEQLDADTDYVEQIGQTWRQGLPMPHSQHGSENHVRLHVKDSGSGLKAQLLFSDRSGEEFQQQWQTRRLERRFADQLKIADGLLVFVHPNSLRTGVRLDACCDEESDEEGGPMGEWDPSIAPTEVEMVEILQFIPAMIDVTPLPIAIVVSAWDEAVTTDATPSAWLANRLPLLKQFLDTNAQHYATAIYGVSAQGGDVTQPSKKQAVLEKERPSDRIIVIGPDDWQTDITAPIRWLMRQAAAEARE
jgi:hypothetical protein